MVLKRSVFLMGLIFLLCSCSGGNTVEIIKNTEKTEEWEIYTETPKLSTKNVFAENINADIQKRVDDTLQSFKDEAGKSEGKDDALNATSFVSFSKNGILSVVIDCEKYTGGVHGELGRIVKNLDMQNEKELAFCDLFSDEKFPDRINAYIEQVMQDKPTKYKDIWKKPVVDADELFYLSDAGVVIYYLPYELSYYSRGFVEFEIPYEELEGYIKPEYLERLCK